MMIKKIILVILFLLITSQPAIATEYIFKHTIEDMVTSTIKDNAIPEIIKTATIKMLKNKNSRFTMASTFVVFMWDETTTITMQFTPPKFYATSLTSKRFLIPILFSLVKVDVGGTGLIKLLWARK